MRKSPRLFLSSPVSFPFNFPLTSPVPYSITRLFDWTHYLPPNNSHSVCQLLNLFYQYVTFTVLRYHPVSYKIPFLFVHFLGIEKKAIISGFTLMYLRESGTFRGWGISFQDRNCDILLLTFPPPLPLYSSNSITKRNSTWSCSSDFIPTQKQEGERPVLRNPFSKSERLGHAEVKTLPL